MVQWHHHHAIDKLDAAGALRQRREHAGGVLPEVVEFVVFLGHDVVLAHVHMVETDLLAPFDRVEQLLRLRKAREWIEVDADAQGLHGRDAFLVVTIRKSPQRA